MGREARHRGVQATTMQVQSYGRETRTVTFHNKVLGRWCWCWWHRVRELVLVGHVWWESVLARCSSWLYWAEKWCWAWHQWCSQSSVLVHTGACGQCHPVMLHLHWRHTLWPHVSSSHVQTQRGSMWAQGSCAFKVSSRGFSASDEAIVGQKRQRLRKRMDSG